MFSMNFFYRSGGHFFHRWTVLVNYEKHVVRILQKPATMSRHLTNLIGFMKMWQRTTKDRERATNCTCILFKNQQKQICWSDLFSIRFVAGRQTNAFIWIWTFQTKQCLFRKQQLLPSSDLLLIWAKKKNKRQKIERGKKRLVNNLF